MPVLKLLHQKGITIIHNFLYDVYRKMKLNEHGALAVVFDCNCLLTRPAFAEKSVNIWVHGGGKNTKKGVRF